MRGVDLNPRAAFSCDSVAVVSGWAVVAHHCGTVGAEETRTRNLVLRISGLALSGSEYGLFVVSDGDLEITGSVVHRNGQRCLSRRTR